MREATTKIVPENQLNYLEVKEAGYLRKQFFSVQVLQVVKAKSGFSRKYFGANPGNKRDNESLNIVSQDLMNKLFWYLVWCLSSLNNCLFKEMVKCI
jgi:hypothetical protein